MLSGLRARLGAEDPVLQILSVTTIVATLGRGVFLTLSTLYLSLVLHLSPAAVALVFGVGAVVAIVFALLGGQLADRYSSRRIALVALVIGSLALLAYAFAQSLAVVLVITIIENAAIAVGQSARSAILGRGFEGAAGVRARAVLRTVTNVGIGIGSGVASIPLAFGAPFAYRLAFVIAAVVVTVGQLPLVRLPSRVDAPIAQRRAAVVADQPIAGETLPGAEAVAEVAVEAAEDDAEPRRRGRLPGRSPWRDPRYLLLSLLSGALGVQFMVQEVGAPLWVAHETTAPTAIVSVLLIINTVVVIIFTVPLSKGTHRLRMAGRVTLLAGGLLVLACAGYAAAHGLPVFWACVALIVAAIIAAFAEVLSQAGGWGLSFELADRDRMGSYQGVFGTSFAVASAVGPALITSTAIAWGWPGWGVLAAVFIVAAAGTAGIAEHAARRHPELA
jgi:MFS family permease